MREPGSYRRQTRLTLACNDASVSQAFTCVRWQLVDQYCRQAAGYRDNRFPPFEATVLSTISLTQTITATIQPAPRLCYIEAWKVFEDLRGAAFRLDMLSQRPGFARHHARLKVSKIAAPHALTAN